jgi:hypothetical protein
VGSLVPSPAFPAMSPAAIAQVNEWTEKLRQCPQLHFVTEHLLHGGVYYRTVRLPAGAIGTSVLVKGPSAVIMSGEAYVYIGAAEPLHVNGINQVLPAAAGRKQAFFAVTDIAVTMSFATDAKNVAEAEAAFTDELEFLQPLADADRHLILVTGE